MAAHLRRILVIRFSAIGDIVLTSPVIRCIKQQLPDTELHVATKAQYATILQANPYIDQLHTLKDSLKTLANTLQQFRFDYIIDLHHNQRTWLLKRMLQRPGSAVDKKNWTKWRMVHLPNARLSVSSIVERYFAAAASIGVKADGEGLDHFIADNDHIAISAMPGIANRPFVAAVIGGSYPTKVLPLEHWIAIIDKCNLPFVLLGGPDDKDMADRLQEAFPKKVVHNIGHWSVQQSASVVQQAAAVVANDTGLMHVAVAFRKPLAVIWGSTVPAFGMAPYYGSAAPPLHRHFSVAGLRCRPCSKLGHQQCPKGHFNCMQQHNPNEIAGFVHEAVGFIQK